MLPLINSYLNYSLNIFLNFSRQPGQWGDICALDQRTLGEWKKIYIQENIYKVWKWEEYEKLELLNIEITVVSLLKKRENVCYLTYIISKNSKIICQC